MTIEHEIIIGRSGTGMSISTFLESSQNHPAGYRNHNVSRAAAIAVLDAIAATVHKDPTILEVIEQAIPQGEQRRAYRVWLDQYRFCPDGKVKLDQNRLGEVFSGLGHLTEHICWADLYEAARQHQVPIVCASGQEPCSS